MTVQEAYEDAVQGSDLADGLYAGVERMLAEGDLREDGLAQLRALYLKLRAAGNERERDAVAEVMDYLVGFCSPGARL